MVEISFELFNNNSNNLLRVFVKSPHPNQLSYKAYIKLNVEKEMLKFDLESLRLNQQNVNSFILFY